MEGGKEIFKRVHYMETKFHVVPETLHRDLRGLDR